MKFKRFKIPGRFPSQTSVIAIFCIFFSFLLQSSVPGIGKLGEKQLFLFDRIYKGVGNPSFVNIEKIGDYTFNLLTASENVSVDRPVSFFGKGSSFPDEKELATSRKYASYDRIGYGYLHYFVKDNVRLYIYELRIFNREKKKFFSYCTFFKWPYLSESVVEDLVNQVVIPSFIADNSSIKKKSGLKKNIDGKKKTILLDPGHGGHNFGAALPKELLKYKQEEKDLNSDIAQLVGDRLEKMGFAVRYTRLPEEDYFLSLDERAIICNIYNPDLFVSLHHDGGVPDSHGFRLFYSDYKPLIDVEDLEIFLENEFESDQFMGEILINDLTYLFYREKNGAITYTTSKLSNWDVLDKTLSNAAVVSRDLGEKVVRNFIKDLTYVKPHPKKGRHAIASAYFVLRKTRCPSILIENGYMSTPDEFYEVRKPENQRLFAKSLTDSIFRYYYPDLPLPEIDKSEEVDLGTDSKGEASSLTNEN